MIGLNRGEGTWNRNKLEKVRDYVSNRQCKGSSEDHSANGDAELCRYGKKRAWRWGEEGIAESYDQQPFGGRFY